MVQHDPHPIANRKGHENGAGYGRQGGRQEIVETIASPQLQGYKNGYGGQVQEPPPNQRQGNQSQSFMPKPNLNQAQGGKGSAAINHGPYTTEEPSSQRQGSQPQSSMSNTISTQAQGKIGGPTFHHGPSPTQVRENQSQNSSTSIDENSAYNDHVYQQPLTEGEGNHPHPTSATTKPYGHAYANDNESRRKAYDDKLSSHVDSAHYQPPIAPVRRTEEDGNDFEHHDWKTRASHEPKNVPSDALELDHINADKEPNKFHAGKGKPSASPTTEMVQDKPRIQVNVNVFYDQDGDYRVDSTPHQPQPPPPRRPSSVPEPAPTPTKHSPIRPPPPKSGSSSCCSIL